MQIIRKTTCSHIAQSSCLSLFLFSRLFSLINSNDFALSWWNQGRPVDTPRGRTFFPFSFNNGSIHPIIVGKSMSISRSTRNLLFFFFSCRKTVHKNVKREIHEDEIETTIPHRVHRQTATFFFLNPTFSLRCKKRHHAAGWCNSFSLFLKAEADVVASYCHRHTNEKIKSFDAQCNENEPVDF